MIWDIRRHDANERSRDDKVCNTTDKKPSEYKHTCCKLPVYSLIVFKSGWALHNMTLFMIKITVRKLAEFRLNNLALLDELLNYVCYARL